MRIRSIELHQFGPHQHTVGDALKDGLIVIYGPNEIGKSSLLAALRGILFGRARGVEPVLDTETGARGQLTVETADGILTIRRPLSARKPPQLVLPDGTSAQGEAALRQWLPGLTVIDESIYQSIFTFQLAELNDLSDEGDLSTQIYAAGLVGHISPLGIEQRLSAKVRDLYNPNPRARRQPLNECLRDIKQLTKALGDVADKPEDYLRAEAEAGRCQTQMTELQAALVEQLQVQRQIEKELELLPVHRQIIECTEALQTLSELPVTDPYDQSVLAQSQSELTRLEADVQELAEIDGDLQSAMTEQGQLRRRLSDAWREERMNDLHVDEALMSRARRIAEDWRGQVQATERLRDRLDESSRRRQRAEDAARHAHIDIESGASVLLANREQLHQDAQAIQADRERLQRLEHLSLEAKQAAQQMAQASVPAVAKTARGWRVAVGVVLLAATVLAASRGQWLVTILTGLAGLWGIFDIEQRLLWRNRTEFVRENPEVARVQALTVEMAALRDSLTIITLQREPDAMTQADWQACYEVLRGAEHQYDKALRQLDERDRLWQAYVGACEEVLSCEDAVRAGEATQGRVSEAFTQLCKDIGAPDFGSPDDLPVELEQLMRWQTGQQQLDQRRTRQREKQQRLAVKMAAIGQTLSEIEQQADQWDRGTDAALETATTRERQSLDATVAASDAELSAVLTTLKNRLGRLIVQAEAVMQELNGERARQRDIRQKLEQMQHVAAGMCGSVEAYTELAERLDGSTEDGISAKLAVQKESVKQIEQALAEARDAKAAITNRLKAWSTEESSKRQWALSEAKAKRGELAEKWAVMTMAQALVHESRERFEAERQPAVLGQAGRLLADFTDGRYVRLQSRVDANGKPELLCVDAKGIAWQPKQLSRGTREQIYLCLRFAMIEDYRQKGTRLPVILDDPMVNFDAGRQQRALRFIAGQAVQQQTLYLTCQPHVARTARELGADVLAFAGHDQKQLVPWEDANGTD